MQYILQDLLKLSLADRLLIIETAISSIGTVGQELILRDMLSQQLSNEQEKGVD